MPFFNKYGFATFEGDWTRERGSQLRDSFFEHFHEEASGYRIYWKALYDKILAYYAKECSFGTLQENVDFCLTGLTLIADF
ncbi:MAG: hypothetical protein H6573_33550 [Lewinellaceae bacterium]|nr:hypothetical protein [Lewinellaceae bacterium]